MTEALQIIALVWLAGLVPTVAFWSWADNNYDLDDDGIYRCLIWPLLVLWIIFDTLQKKKK